MFTHFLLFPNLHEVVVDRFVVSKNHSFNFGPHGPKNYDKIEEIKEYLPLDIGHHFEVMFTDRLELFIPVTLIFLVVVWFFNDKIKAR